MSRARWAIVLAAVVVLAPGCSTAPPAGREEGVATLRYTFDVPSLVGKNVDEVRVALGPYALADEEADPTEAQISAGVTEWSNSFTKDGEELLVTYNVASRRVVDFFLSARTQDKDLLLRTGNLDPSSPRYRLEYVENLEDRSQITGVKVIPNAP